MTLLEEIQAQTIGAQFLRADLHIHSYGGSHDVKDPRMTPSAIVQTAINEGLSIVAIADHNEIVGATAAIEAAHGTSLLVIPAVELSTLQGHLLCYLPTIEALRKFHARLSIVDGGEPNSRCQQSIMECLNLLLPLNGFGILAHVDIPSGFEYAVPGASPHKTDVICHAGLLGIELKDATSLVSYAEGDPDPNRSKMGRDRIDRLELGSRQYLARVLNSDAHALDALGRNAANLRRVTRYKMDAPTYDGLRVALEDADARVRIEDQIPQTVPRIVGMRLDGGFLSGQIVHFSPNLNCIIGGRGTGKSTAFESVRCLASGAHESKVVDSEVWPDVLELFWQDQAGQYHGVRRAKGGDLQNMDASDHAPCTFDIDCVGQGEAARISHEAQSDPLALLRYLDRFVELDQPSADEDTARENLLALQTEIEKAEQQVQLIPQFEGLLSTARQQLAALKKPEVKELIELQQHLASERELRAQIAVKVKDIQETLKRGSPKKTLKELKELADPAQLAVGATEFRAIVDGVSAFDETVGMSETQMKTALADFEGLVAAQTSSWKMKEGDCQQKIDAKRRELEAMNVSFDMSYIRKLTADEASHQQSVNNLNTWKPHLVEQRRLRNVALKERWLARERVANLRDAFGRRASQILGEALSDIQVSLKFSRNAYSPDAADLIIQAMGWRTNQQPRANWLVQELTIPVLLDAIQRRDLKPILDLRTPEGVAVFKPDDAAQVVERLSTPSIRFALERSKLYDTPRLQVSRAVSDGKGGTKHVVREFSKLSLGQQQSVLLALILSADSNKPLIVDQPEDNLDGEFIYTTLVPVLRRAKERRQVVIVTHNANVAVLGDAELIVVMKARNDRGEIVSRGSIDNTATRDAGCAILEGAREAFLRRAKMYGIRTSVGL